MDPATSLMYFGEVRAGGFCDPLGSHYAQQSSRLTPEETVDLAMHWAGSQQWSRSRTTTVETRVTVLANSPSLPSVDLPEQGGTGSLWTRLVTWIKTPRRITNHVADVGSEASDTTSVLSSADSTESESGATEIVTVVETETMSSSLVLWSGDRGIRSEEQALVRATRDIVIREEREERIFGDAVEPSASKQTYKKFIEIEYSRGRKRGTRGRQRPYRCKKIEYCSLLEHAVRLMSDPNFKFSDGELADIYRELMAIHKREGCEIGFGNKKTKKLTYERAGPGQHGAMVASHCREALCPGSGFVQAQFEMVRREVSDDLRARWNIHWAATENRTRPTLVQRFKLNWWVLKTCVGLSAPLPPRQ